MSHDEWRDGECMRVYKDKESYSKQMESHSKKMWLITADSESGDHYNCCVKNTKPTLEWFNEYFKDHGECTTDMEDCPNPEPEYREYGDTICYSYGHLYVCAELLEIEE